MAYIVPDIGMSVLSFNSEKEAASPEFPEDSPRIVAGEDALQPWRKRNEVYEALDGNSGNRTINDDNALDFLRELTLDADKELQHTYRCGKQIQSEPSAPSIKVGIYYVPGADLAQVNVMENSEINKDADVHKSARWKTLTAGNILLEQEVQRDLGIIQVDQTPKVVAAYKERKARAYKLGSTVEGIKDLAKSSANDTVNISSKNVTLLNAHSKKGRYDLESTCIEVDGLSLLNLIFNFRNLISREGQFATISAQQTVEILETMVEDARRLLIRSPILTRATKRHVIQTSCNTRYGLDTGTMFHTFTTSRGIAEMIQQGVGYYSSLNGYSEARTKVRPQFLQMVVFLLSLLNDQDLQRLKPSLEMSYDLKADRESIELTVFKVLTYAAVSSYSFLSGIISSIKGLKTELEDTEKAKKKAWEEFLFDIGKNGWLLPGPGKQVGRDDSDDASWMVEWNKEFINSDIFDHLQYQGEKNTVNSIPPLKVNSEAFAAQEATAELSNGQLVSLSVKDLDDITNAVPSRYQVTQQANRQPIDITVREQVLFQVLDTVWENLNQTCSTVNECANTTSAVSRRGSFISLLSTGKLRESRPYFNVQKPLGRRTQHTTDVLPGSSDGTDTIAVSWKLEGRRITQKELIKGVHADIKGFQNTLEMLNEFRAKQERTVPTGGSEQMPKLLKRLDVMLRNVEKALRLADNQRVAIRAEISQQTTPDEPIKRVYFTTNIHQKQDRPFCQYGQVLSDASLRLAVTSERHIVVEEPLWTTGSKHTRVRLGGQLSILVAPMADVGGAPLLDDDFEGEVSKGEMVLLLGGIVAVVDPRNYRVLNYLHLLGVERGEPTTRRRRDPDRAKVVHRETIIP